MMMETKLTMRSLTSLLKLLLASLKIQWMMMHATNEFCRGLEPRTN